MINIRPLIEARIADQIAGFNEVAGAANLQAVLEGRLNAPGCYIYQENASAEPSSVYGKVQQRKTVQISLVIVVKNHVDARGIDSSDRSFEFQQDIEAALLGWKPHADSSPMEYASGGLVQLSNGFLAWKETYQSRQFINSQ